MTEQIGAAAIPQQTPPPGTIVFRTRGIDPDPVRPAREAVAIRGLPSARAAAFASAVVLSLNALPRLQPLLAERFGLTGPEGEAAVAVGRAATTVTAPIVTPDPALPVMTAGPSALLMPGWAASALLLLALATAACLLFRAPLPRRAWAALLAATAVLGLVPAWNLLTGDGHDKPTTGAVILLALASSLLIRALGRGTAASIARPLRSPAVAGVLLSIAVPAALAVYESQPDWLQGGTASASRAPATLEEQRAADAGAVAGLHDTWVAQLASNRGGDPAYLDEHRRIAAAYGAVLVRGDDVWSDQLDASYWLTVGTTTFPTGQAALAWCDQQGLDRNHCIGRMLATGPVPQSVAK